jgi:hypothetical protein
MGCGPFEHALDAGGLLAHIMALGGAAGGGVRTRERGRSTERIREGVEIERVDEHSRIGWDELRRAAHAGGDNRAAGGHCLEHRLAERLDQARLAYDVGCGEAGGHGVVGDAAGELDAWAAHELRPQRAVAYERKRPFA